MARLFVAAWPPPEIVEQLEALPRPETRGVRWVRPEHWHVTLRFLGEAESDEAVEALGALAAPSARAVLGPTVSRLGRGVICVPVAGLERLAAAVGEVTADVGQPPDPRPFAGHLTLARLRHRAACELAGSPVDGSFPVDSIELVASHLDHDGPTYERRAVFRIARQRRSEGEVGDSSGRSRSSDAEFMQ